MSVVDDPHSQSGLARLATRDEIAANDWNLNIPRYVQPAVEEETLPVAEAIRNLKQALDAAYAAEDRLKTLLPAAGWMP